MINCSDFFSPMDPNKFTLKTPLPKDCTELESQTLVGGFSADFHFGNLRFGPVGCLFFQVSKGKTYISGV